MTTPCSASDQAVLKQVDDITFAQKARIVDFYTRLCADGQQTCPPLDPVFATLRGTTVDRFCATSDRDDRFGVTFLSNNRPTVSIYPRAFATSRTEGDVCSLTSANLHERMHAVYDLGSGRPNHSSDSFDPAYIAGNAAELACITASHPDHLASLDNPSQDPFLRAQQVFFERKRTNE